MQERFHAGDGMLDKDTDACELAVRSLLSGCEFAGAAYMAWFKNGRFRVALGISARTLIGPAGWSGFT